MYKEHKLKLRWAEFLTKQIILGGNRTENKERNPKNVVEIPWEIAMEDDNSERNDHAWEKEFNRDLLEKSYFPAMKRS